MVGIPGKQPVLLVGVEPVRLVTADRRAPRSELRRATEESRLTTFCKALRERAHLSFSYFPLNLVCQSFTTCTGSKIALYLFIPRRVFQFLKPSREFVPIFFGQLLDRFFNGFERHIDTLA